MSYDTKERSIITYLSSPRAPRRASVPICSLMERRGHELYNVFKDIVLASRKRRAVHSLCCSYDHKVSISPYVTYIIKHYLYLEYHWHIDKEN